MSDRQPCPDAEAKPVPGFPSYAVGPDGTVWSYSSRFAGNGKTAWRKLKQFKDGNGYLAVSMRGPDQRRHNGNPVVKKVHRLVLETFVGPCPPGMMARHLDDDRENNTVKNLRWGTTLQNTADAFANGRLTSGTEAANAKLSDEDFRVIDYLIIRGAQMEAIALAFRVSFSTVERYVCERRRALRESKNA